MVAYLKIRIGRNHLPAVRENEMLTPGHGPNFKYFMTLPFANHILIDKEKVEQILFECTDRRIGFDGYRDFIMCILCIYLALLFIGE